MQVYEIQDGFGLDHLKRAFLCEGRSRDGSKLQGRRHKQTDGKCISWSA